MSRYVARGSWENPEPSRSNAFREPVLVTPEYLGLIWRRAASWVRCKVRHFHTRLWSTLY